MRKLTAYMTANSSDSVKLQSVDSLAIKKVVITMNIAPKKYEYAVTERLAGYSFKTRARICLPQEIRRRKV